MFIDQWQTRSKPIEIPVAKYKTKYPTYMQLRTDSGDIVVTMSSVSFDLFTGYVVSTPPNTKNYKKGDKVIFHRHNILNLFDSPKDSL